MGAYYNEIDSYAAQWLRNLIGKGLIPAGEVDERSICDVDSEDLRGFTQCHFFAGLGGWAYAARLAGWPDDRPLWTGSCPCQPFSVAGKQQGQEDERHLWPVFFDLIRACRPPVVMGEQVAAAIGKNWLDGVCADLEGVGYATGAAVVPACAVDAPHRRDRLWFVADANIDRREARIWNNQAARHRHPFAAAGDADGGGDVADAGSIGRDWRPSPARRETRTIAGPEGSSRSNVADADEPRSQGRRFLPECSDQRSAWSNGVEWAIGADGKARRVEPSIRLLAHGVPARVGRLRAYGNAIVPQIAAEIIGAYLDVAP